MLSSFNCLFPQSQASNWSQSSMMSYIQPRRLTRWRLICAPRGPQASPPIASAQECIRFCPSDTDANEPTAAPSLRSGQPREERRRSAAGAGLVSEHSKPRDPHHRASSALQGHSTSRTNQKRCYPTRGLQGGFHRHHSPNATAQRRAA